MVEEEEEEEMEVGGGGGELRSELMPLLELALELCCC